MISGPRANHTEGFMEDSINTRLKAARVNLQLSQRDFSKAILISQSFYARLEQGRVKPNNRIIELVCSRLAVNREWLLTGKGEMFSDTPPDIKLEQLYEIFTELNGLFQDYLIVQAKELLKVQNRSKDEGGKNQLI
jgi:transcriptional regulator with XRE-family HTH domain